MKILLDECVDVRLAVSLTPYHEVRTVHEQGWSGISNGKLLGLAAGGFDILVTVDRNLSFQQHLPKFDIAVVLLLTRTNRLIDLIDLVPDLLAAIPMAAGGSVTRVGRA